MMNEIERSVPHLSPHLKAIESLYGPIPPKEDTLRVHLVHQVQRSTHVLSLWQLSVGRAQQWPWTLYVACPLNIGATTVIVSPDGCWPDMVMNHGLSEVLGQGLALAWFDRTVLAWDGPNAERGGLVHDRWPDTAWSAMAAWAWGISEAVTALRHRIFQPFTHVAVVGHSRGGKAALLAAAIDDQIAAVVAHNSGTGGAASLHRAEPGAETLAELAKRFPHWLSPHAQDMAVQAALVEADAPRRWLQTIAPRGLCLLQADDDAWANPIGTQHMLEQIAHEWRSQPDRLALLRRTGGHAMTSLDWQRAAHFIVRATS